MSRDEVGKFGQICLPKNYRAGGEQLANDRRILSGLRSFEGKGTGGGALAVGCCDVVLDEDRDTGERAAVRRLLPVGQCCDGERVRIDLAHRIEAPPGAVIGRDAGEVACVSAVELVRPSTSACCTSARLALPTWKASSITCSPLLKAPAPGRPQATYPPANLGQRLPRGGAGGVRRVRPPRSVDAPRAPRYNRRRPGCRGTTRGPADRDLVTGS
jgi:hypothetical protein